MGSSKADSDEGAGLEIKHILVPQLQSALAAAGKEALGAENLEEATDAHLKIVRSLIAALASVTDHNLKFDMNKDFPLLCGGNGAMFLTVCGFEDAGDKPGIYRLERALVKGCQLAVPVVRKHLASFSGTVSILAPNKSTNFARESTRPFSEGSKLPLHGYWRTSLDELNFIDEKSITAPNGTKLAYSSSNDGLGITIVISDVTHKARLSEGVLYWGDGDVWRQVRFEDEDQSINSLDEAKAAALAAGQDPELSIAMAVSMEEDSFLAANLHERPGAKLSDAQLIAFGIAFERQPDCSDTCAVHGLNNLVQAKPTETEGVRSSLDTIGWPFSILDLQRAEAESRRELEDKYFVPPTEKQLSILRTQSGLQGPRTGMFDVEAIKVAAKAKGYSVIDTEPNPTWDSSAAAKYVEAARIVENSCCTFSSNPSTDCSLCTRWFVGFLVYERIPGRAMHYYALLRYKSPTDAEMWLLLDSMDRGDQKPRNRLMTCDDLIRFHNDNSEYFKSWLVRWYPVVDMRAAVEALRMTLVARLVSLTSGSAAVAEGTSDRAHIQEFYDGESKHEGVVPIERAKETLDSEQARWNVWEAANELIGAGALVTRELQVLRFALSEEQARIELRLSGWDLEKAMRVRMERLLQHQGGVADASEGTSPNTEGDASAPSTCGIATASALRHGLLPAILNGPLGTFLSLRMVDWDVRCAAQLLLTATLCASPSTASARELLQQAKAALEVCAWNLDSAFAILQLLRNERSRIQVRRDACGDSVADIYIDGSDELSAEEIAHRVLHASGFDQPRASRLLEVVQEFPSAPLPVCAEALKHSDDHPGAACELLRERKARVEGLVAKVMETAHKCDKGKSQTSHSQTTYTDINSFSCARLERDCAAVASLALEVSEWNSAVAFPAAESFALGLMQIRSELLRIQACLRERALAIAQKPSAPEDLVASALSALDALDVTEKQMDIVPPDVLLTALQEQNLNPHEVAGRLCERHIPPELKKFRAQLQASLMTKPTPTLPPQTPREVSGAPPADDKSKAKQVTSGKDTGTGKANKFPKKAPSSGGYPRQARPTTKSDEGCCVM